MIIKAWHVGCGTVPPSPPAPLFYSLEPQSNDVRSKPVLATYDEGRKWYFTDGNSSLPYRRTLNIPVPMPEDSCRITEHAHLKKSHHPASPQGTKPQ